MLSKVSINCHACVRAGGTFIGPVRNMDTQVESFLCTACDASHTMVAVVCGEDMAGRTCVAEWLTGQQLADGEIGCLCFQTDPYPAGEPKQRRFFHYHTIAKLLGAKGQFRRVDLPPCVKKRIAENYPDRVGEATKVGFQRAR